MVTFVLYHKIYLTLALYKWTEFYTVILFIIFILRSGKCSPSMILNRDNYEN